MESDSGSITLKKASRKDIKEITELFYITEPEPELEWGYGSEKERKQVLEHLMKIKNNRFSLKNFIVARKDNKLIGMALLIDGKDIDRITINSEKKVVKIQKGFLNKLGYFYSSIRDYFFFRECEDDEFYISNLAIKKEFRGNGYAKVMIDKISKMAKRKDRRSPLSCPQGRAYCDSSTRESARWNHHGFHQARHSRGYGAG